MWTDPVVNEIHRVRQKMLADAGGNAKALMQKFRDHQASSGRMVIGTVRRRLVTADDQKAQAKH